MRYRIRGNFIEIVDVIVPSKFEQYGFLSLFQDVFSRGFPFRCGVVLVPDSEDDEASKHIISLARSVCESGRHIRKPLYIH